MDGARFDHLARTLAGRAGRRGVVAGLAALAAGLAGFGEAGAQTCPPGRVSRRGLGCVCRRTGRPPVGGVCPCLPGQRDTGDGQGCLGCREEGDCPASDACATYACGSTGACVRTTQPDGACCPGGRCQGGACAPVVATLADCQGRCDHMSDPATVEVCGQPVTCPSCFDCGALGCDSTAGANGSGPAGFGLYCIEGGGTGDCFPGECPAGSGCFGGTCFAICLGEDGAG